MYFPDLIEGGHSLRFGFKHALDFEEVRVGDMVVAQAKVFCVWPGAEDDSSDFVAKITFHGRILFITCSLGLVCFKI